MPPEVIQLWESDVNPCQMAEYGTVQWWLEELLRSDDLMGEKMQSDEDPGLISA